MSARPYTRAREATKPVRTSLPGMLPAEPLAPPPPPPVVHRCAHPSCAAQGSFGFGFVPGGVGRWFCFAHRADGERLPSEPGCRP